MKSFVKIFQIQSRVSCNRLAAGLVSVQCAIYIDSWLWNPPTPPPPWDCIKKMDWWYKSTSTNWNFVFFQGLPCQWMAIGWTRSLGIPRSNEGKFGYHGAPLNYSWYLHLRPGDRWWGPSRHNYNSSSFWIHEMLVYPKNEILLLFNFTLLALPDPTPLWNKKSGELPARQMRGRLGTLGPGMPSQGAPLI